MKTIIRNILCVCACTCAVAMLSAQDVSPEKPAERVKSVAKNQPANPVKKDAEGWPIAELGKGEFTVHCPATYKEDTRSVKVKEGEVTIHEIVGQTEDQMGFRISELPIGLGLKARTLDEFIQLIKSDHTSLEEVLVHTTLKDHPAAIFSSRTATGVLFRYAVFLDTYCIFMEFQCSNELEEKGGKIADRFMSSLRPKEADTTDEIKLLGVKAPSRAALKQLSVPDRPWIGMDYELTAQLLTRGEAILPRLSDPAGAKFWESLTSPANLDFADDKRAQLRSKMLLLRTAAQACSKISNVVTEGQKAFGGYQPEFYALRAYQLRVLTKTIALDMEYASQMGKRPELLNNLPQAFLGEAAGVIQKSSTPDIQNTLLDAMKDTMPVLARYWAADQRGAIALALAKVQQKVEDKDALAKINELLAVARSTEQAPGEIDAKPDFKELRWATSQETVVASESAQPEQKSATSVIYQSTLGGEDAALMYYFDGTPPLLTGAAWMMHRTIAQEEDLRRAFAKMKAELTAKYGEPSGYLPEGKPPTQEAKDNLLAGKTMDGRTIEKNGDATQDMINNMPVIYYCEYVSWRTNRTGIRLDIEMSSDGNGWVTLLETSESMVGDISAGTSGPLFSYTSADKFKDQIKAQGTAYAGGKK